jgi:hypothetical protein
MKSPFPGMDPYLEWFWGDMQTSMAVYLRDQLRPQMPSDLVVRIEEYVSVEDVDEEPYGYVPDVHVVKVPGGGGTQPRATATATTSKPFVIPLRHEPRTLRSVRIIDTSTGHKIVTAIEILSPANKVGRKGRAAYEKKRKDLLTGGRVNLVEIDLIREGDPILLVADHHVPGEYYKPYRVCVLRATKKRQVEFYQATFRERLPTIPIPLRAKDRDAALNLQALIDQCYENGDYGHLIDYRESPRPPLRGDDAEWADALLRQQGRR